MTTLAWQAGLMRPKVGPEHYIAPSAAERASGAVVYCDGCELSWPRRLAVPRLKKCRNCARAFWRESQAAHRLRSEERPMLRVPGSMPKAPEGMDVDAHLAQFDGAPEPVRRAPRPPEEKHDPNESIESIVSRMGAEVIDVPMLPAPRKR